MKKKMNPYLTTYIVWLVIILMLILNSETENGDSYPVGEGIFVSIVCAVIFSLPIWIVQVIYFWWKRRKSRAKNTFTVEKKQKTYESNSSLAQKNLENRLSQDELICRAMDVASEQGWISTTFLQTNFHLKYRDAARLIDTFELNGWIEPWDNSLKGIRRLAITKREWSFLQGSYAASAVSRKTREEAPKIDNMDGHQFENYCASLLLKNGFSKAEVTKASGDFGIDVLGKKDGVTYAIQCKCYSDKVGNHAVQEALSGAQFYHCMVAVVMTNNYFTPAAIETAQRTNVLLWNRDKVLEMASSGNG